ncbi:MAG: DUF983 domain-containing protein [Planctomycetota bacterium]|nr:MAG: DUF983 domain-containing protein [Planctomycetota bacterium]
MATSPRSLRTVLWRGLRLRCPRCGRSSLFRTYFRMVSDCPECGFHFERDPGYFLGSVYLNYGLTALSMTVAYVTLHLGLGVPNRVLLGPLLVWCVVFPLVFFRFARALWLAMDCYFDNPDRTLPNCYGDNHRRSGGQPEERMSGTDCAPRPLGPTDTDAPPARDPLGH